MPGELDFVGLARKLQGRARELMPVWLPGGRVTGKEYVCGGLRGGPGESMSVNLETGKWADFADSDSKGGDLISLFAAINGVGQGEAAKRLADQVGHRLNPNWDPNRRAPAKRSAGPPRAPRPPASEPEPPAEAKVFDLIIPPDDAAPPLFHHPVHGPPSDVWTYRDEAGRQMFHVARYQKDAENKVFSPWSWSKEAGAWVMKGWEAPRPLYGLELLAQAPKLPVMVVEGEKAAEAARRLAGNAYLVVSWPNGSQAAKNASWSVLRGRRVLLWPDADRKTADTQAKADKHGVGIGQIIPYQGQPGPRAMAEIAAILSHICPEVKVINVGIDQERADGWDAADAEADGWTWENLVSWARPRAALWEPYHEEKPELNLTVQTAVQQNVEVKVEAAKDPDTKVESPSLYAAWEELGIVVSSQGSPIANVDNALRVIQRHPDFQGLVWFDEFHQKYLTKWGSAAAREWRDVDDLNLTAFMQRDLGIRRMSDDMVNKAARIHAHKNIRNEPRDWLESRTWDGTPRLETFFVRGFGAEDNEYVRAAARNFWTGMVARVYRPGCQVDNMVVLEGAQGAGKTRALRLIGGPWYAEAHESVTDKDFFMVLHGKLIVEIAELDAFNRAEVTRIKQVVSCTTDRYRAPYGRAAQDHPRMSVFVGTTNEKAYLRDNTGGRRFWPVPCATIDQAFLAEFREQFYAEAVACFKNWEKTQADADGWWLMPAAATSAVQEERRQADEWEGILEDFLRNRVEIRLHDLAQECLKIDAAKLDRFIQHRIAGILRTIGWAKHNVTRGGVQMKVWRKDGTPEDVTEPPLEFNPF